MVQDQNNEKAYGKYQFTVSPADPGVSPSSLLCQQKPLLLISCVFSPCFFMQIQTHVSMGTIRGEMTIFEKLREKKCFTTKILLF